MDKAPHRITGHRYSRKRRVMRPHRVAGPQPLLWVGAPSSLLRPCARVEVRTRSRPPLASGTVPRLPCWGYTPVRDGGLHKKSRGGQVRHWRLPRARRGQRDLGSSGPGRGQAEVSVSRVTRAHPRVLLEQPVAAPQQAVAAACQGEEEGDGLIGLELDGADDGAKGGPVECCAVP